MTDHELQDAFFSKAIQSIKLAVTLLVEEKVSAYKASAVGELFHGYELLLKSHVAKHNKYLLVLETKSAVIDDWKIADFDSLLTKPANELPKLLFALEGGAPRVTFLYDEKALIEKMRRERNRYEHGAVGVSSGYVSLVLAPFFHRVILPLIEFSEKKYSDFFSDEDRLELLQVVEDPKQMLPNPSLFWDDPRSCPSCLNRFSFLNRDKDILRCLICNMDTLKTKDIRFAKCPCCQGEIISYDQTVECLGECRKKYVKEKYLARGQVCKCGSSNVSSIYDETGDESGFCLSCLSAVELMWRCDHCYEFRLDDNKVEPPEELRGDNLCDDCEPNIVAAYAPQD